MVLSRNTFVPGGCQFSNGPPEEDLRALDQNLIGLAEEGIEGQVRSFKRAGRGWPKIRRRVYFTYIIHLEILSSDTYTVQWSSGRLPLPQLHTRARLKVLVSLGDFARALALLRRSSVLQEDCPLPYVNAARAYLGMNDLVAARR